MKALVLAMTLLLSTLVQAKEGMLAGNLTSVGSDTLGYLMSLWGENFNQLYPGVNVQVQAAGSSTAPTALAAGAAQLGAMSRPMQAPERQLFEAKYGYPPLAIPVAMDALVVMVNQDNPLQQLSVQQLDAIFSVTRRCGSKKVPQQWGELLLPPQWRHQAIVRQGRNSASGTWGFFKQQALCGGDFRNDVAEFPGSAAVVQAVASNLNAIGYASMGFHLSGVKVLPLEGDDGIPVSPNVENIRSGRYPFARPLYLYINKAPDRPLEPRTLAFLNFVLSPQGQALISGAGYLPLSDTQARHSQSLYSRPDAAPK